MRYGVNGSDEQFRGYIEELTEGIGTEPRSQTLDMGKIDYSGIDDVPDSDGR